CWKERREGLRAYKPCYHNSSRVRWVAQLCAKRGVTCLVRQGRKLMATEEPDEGNLHVRICGEGAGEPVPLPGRRRLTAYARTSLRLSGAPDAQRSAAPKEERAVLWLSRHQVERRRVPCGCIPLA